MKGWPDWLPSRCVRWRWSRWRAIRASNISERRARTPIQSFLGVPLIDRGVLQGVLVVQTVETRTFRDDEIRMLTEAAAQVAPVVSEARTLDRFIAPRRRQLWALARNMWWSWDQDSRQPVSRSGSGAMAGAQSQSDFAADRDSAVEAGAARGGTGAARPDQLCVPPPAGISAGGPDLGRDACGRAAAASGGLFFGGVRPA